jgi:hypothetical protein
MIQSAYLELLKNQINTGHFPKKHPHFAGANLIITDNTNRHFQDGDTVVYTEFAGPISWLVDQLKTIYVDQLDYFNKFDFYKEIGRILLKTLSEVDKDLFDCMQDVVANIEKNWTPK